jgi:hypothetical protein
MSAIEFDYRLLGAGWSEARIADERSHAELTASYLGDALRELIGAVTDVARGSSEARCSWEEEPGEFRWILRRTGKSLNVTILWLEDNMPALPDSDGRSVFSTTTLVSELGRAVVDGSERVLAELGEAEYHRLWVLAPFPTEALEKLRRALADRGT